MSQENVEVLRRQIAAWNAGDMDAFRELCDADVVHAITSKTGPSLAPRWAGTAVMRFIEQLRDTWDADTIEARPATTSTPLTESSSGLPGTAGATALESNIELTTVYGVRKGKIREHGVLLGSRGGPRSRRAFRVGDVAGERRDRADALRPVE